MGSKDSGQRLDGLEDPVFYAQNLYSLRKNLQNPFFTGKEMDSLPKIHQFLLALFKAKKFLVS
jgi:hypothetical protein